MENQEIHNNRFQLCFSFLFYIFPFIMIGAYFIGWRTLFFIGVIPILVLAFLNIYWNFKEANWLYALLRIIIFLVFSEIGYLITQNVLDGICMGGYVSIVVGIIGNLLSKIRENKKATLKIIICIFLLSCTFAIPSNSQIVTKFSGEDALQTEDREVYVEEVDLYSNYTYVKITIKPKCYISRLKIWTSPYTYLQAGYKTLKYLGALSNDGKTYHSLEYDDGYGWDNAYSSYKYSYTLVFEGSPSEGVKEISLVDPGVSDVSRTRFLTQVMQGLVPMTQLIYYH